MPKNFFERKLTRKEFLLFGGALILSVTGISTIIKTISDPSFFEHYPKQEKGYGSKPYGA